MDCDGSFRGRRNSDGEAPRYERRSHRGHQNLVPTRRLLFIIENDLRKVLLIIKKDILAYPGRRKATRKLWKRVSTTPPPKLDTSDKLYAWLMKWEFVYGKGKNCKCELFYDDDIGINAFLRIIKPRHPYFWDAEFYRFLDPTFTERSFSEVIQRFTISALYRILHGQPV
jgi:hypothetical protein